MKNRIFSLSVFFAALLVLSPTIHSTYQYDDVGLVGKNLWIGTLQGIPRFFTGDFFRDVWGDKIYRPFLMLSISADQWILGHQAWTYHLVNLILHGLVSLLFYKVLCRYWGDSFLSLFPPLLFAVHPVHVDAVAFIVNRSDLLAGIFLLSGWLVSLSWGSALLFLCAFLSKESAAFIVVLFPLFLWFSKKLGWKEEAFLFRKTIASLAAFAVYVFMRWYAIGSFGSSVSESFFTDRSAHILTPTIARIFKDYLWLLVFPTHLRVDYSDYSIRGDPFELEAMVSYGIHILLFIYAYSCRRRWPAMMIAIIGFYVSLLPVAHIIPFRDIFAERFLYLPSAFFFVAVALVLHRALQKEALQLAGSFILLLLGFVAFSYATFFRSPITLWTAMAEEQPTNPKFQYNAGVTLFDHRDCTAATQHLMEALRLRPTYGRALRPIAKCMLISGDKEGARRLFERAVEIEPGDVESREDLALSYYFSNEMARAKQEIDAALHLSPHRKRTHEIAGWIEAKSTH